MGKSNLGWLESRFHSSFAEYRTKNINFEFFKSFKWWYYSSCIWIWYYASSLKYGNYFSHIVDGEITHKDSMGNSETLKRGEVQYLSAGDGIYHSEHNLIKVMI